MTNLDEIQQNETIMTLNLRYMRLADINQVVAIDRQAFSTPWSARSYAYEVSESTYSHMVVLERTAPKPIQGWRRLLRGFGSTAPEEMVTEVIGYGGLWNIMDEAHVSTIATASDERGNGYGELLLAAMIQRSITLEAAYIVLEVRVTNTVAQALYKKYDFEITDRKKNYYRDDGEDAFDMRLDLTNETIATFRQRFIDVRERYSFGDTYTDAQRPIQG